jgi:hypothetical protein
MSARKDSQQLDAARIWCCLIYVKLCLAYSPGTAREFMLRRD